MKRLLFFIYLFSSFKLNAQSKYIGHYHDFFGSFVDINTDSTFEYTYHFDLSGSWTKGKWSVNNDTLYFKMIPVYDTLNYIDSFTKSHIVKLVLSGDEKSNTITYDESAINGLSSDGQNYCSYPMELFYKDDKLFSIEKNGKLLKRKVKGFWSKEKFVPWFVKKKDKN